MTAKLSCSASFSKIPKTESVKYLGSKRLLLPAILELASHVNAKTILDGFSGSTRVSQAFAKSEYQVIANDISFWSEILGLCYLCNQHEKHYYSDLIEHLNSVSPRTGWFTENYGGDPNNGNAIQNDGLKKPWQIQNTQKLDAIRDEIDRLNLSKIEKAVALTSLILALDAVDNTIGHFASYLNKWSARSYQPLKLKVPEIFISKEQNSVLRNDIFDTLDHLKIDLAYFDPPYGSNNEKMPPSRVRYAAYYHLWTTVCLNDQPKLFGKAKRRIDSSDLLTGSVFEDFRKNNNGIYIAVEAIDKMLQKTEAQWIILSYSSGGRATAKELESVLKKNGKILKTLGIVYKKNVMAGMSWTNDWIHDVDQQNREFLFMIEKK